MGGALVVGLVASGTEQFLETALSSWWFPELGAAWWVLAEDSVFSIFLVSGKY